EKDPDFDNISEDEKFYVTAPIGITVGVLEAIGVRNALRGNAVVLNLANRALGKSTSKTTAKTFGEFVRKDVDGLLKQGALIITAGGIAEFETGLTQEMAEIGVKAIYNNAKDKNMFQTPDTWDEYVAQVLRAGAQEMIGGFIMGSIPATVNAYKNGTLAELDDTVWEVFKEMAADENYKKMSMTDLKNKILSGDYTVEQAKEIEAAYNELLGIMPSITTDLSTKRQKQAVQLLLQRQQLKSEIAGKAPLLVRGKNKKIKQIEEQITELETEQLEENKQQKQIEEGIDEFGVSSKTQEQTTEDDVTEDAITEEDQGDIEQFFGEETEESTETVEENLSINKKGDITYTPEQKDLRNQAVRAARRAARAISKILPNTRIVLHESNDEYLKYTKGKKGRGEYIDDVVHINLSLVNDSTVGHEVFHAVFLDKLKTDERAARAAARMIVAVGKSLSKSSPLRKNIEAFAANYTGDQEILQNEEMLAELVGILSQVKGKYKELSKPSKSKVVEFLRKIAKSLGIENLLGPEFGKTDESVIDLLNTLSKKIREGEVIEESEVQTLEELDDGTNPIGSPTEVRVPAPRQSKIDFKDSYENSLVTPANKMDFYAWINEVVDNNQKVWFWVADQLGIDEEIGIDGGPSFSHQIEGDIWASSMPIKSIENNIEKADYLAIISGSPLVSKLFNKKVFDIMTSKLGDFNTFKEAALKSKPVKAVREVLEAHESWESLRDDSSMDVAAKKAVKAKPATKNKKAVKAKDAVAAKIGTGRKKFLIALNNSQSAPNAKFTKYVESINGYTDLNTLRDGFYRDNDFKQNDIMLILKPTGVRSGSTHSTYENVVEGEVIGVPDVKIDALEVMPKEMAEQYADKQRAQASQKIAPYGSGVKGDLTKPADRQQKNLAPNGKPSKLSPEQYKLVRTPAFKKWFGDWEADPENASRVLDENGEPMVMYHGTSDNFDEFLYGDKLSEEYEKLGYYTGYNNQFGTHFGDIETAEVFSKKYDGMIMPVFLNIKNPLETPDLGSWQSTKILRHLRDKNKWDVDYKAVREDKKSGGQVLNEELSKKGVDGFVYKNYIEGGGVNSYIIIESKQAKLADGSNKTFDPSKPSIRQQTVQSLAQIYGMNRKGYFPRTTTMFQVQKAFKKYGLGVKKSRDDGYGRGGGLYLTRNGSMYNPFKNAPLRPRQQKPIDEYISEARDANFRDNVIRDFLLRTKKFEAKDIKAALEVSRDMFEKLPDSFKNIEGGVKEGEKLYKKIEDYRRKLEKNNAKRTSWKSDAEIKLMVGKEAKKLRSTYDTQKQIDDKVKKKREQLRKKGLKRAEVKKKADKYRETLEKKRDEKKEAVAEKINKLEANEIRKNKNRQQPLSDQEIMDKLIEFMQEQEAYIKEGDTYREKGKTKYRKGQSTQQARMMAELQSNVGIRPTQDMAAKVRRARRAVRERMKGKRDLQAIKRALRNFMRVSLPADLYTKSEVMKLIRKITDANENNIDNLMREVEEFVITKNVQRLEKQIKDILDGKYTETVSGRKKGVKIDLATMEQIEFINELLYDPVAKINREVKNFRKKLEKENLSTEEIKEKVSEFRKKLKEEE
ncbi:MAG: hypothetical protein ACR2M9_01515, partial [Cyanophyceae cyanobacterium]